MLSKVVYTDNSRDLALTGNIIAEDEYFITLQKLDREYRINKNRIICVEKDKRSKENGIGNTKSI